MKEFHTVEEIEAQESEIWNQIQYYAKRLGIDLSPWELSYANTYTFDGYDFQEPHEVFESSFYNNDMEDHSLGFNFTKGYADNPPDEWMIERIEITQD